MTESPHPSTSTGDESRDDGVWHFAGPESGESTAAEMALEPDVTEGPDDGADASLTRTPEGEADDDRHAPPFKV
jgi:hypothetical protein